MALATAVLAQVIEFNVPGGDLKIALDTYVRQASIQLVYRESDVEGVQTEGVSGALSAEEALQRILSGTSLSAQRDSSGAIAVVRTAKSQASATSSPTASDDEDGSGGGAQLEEIVVTGTHIRGARPTGSPVRTVSRGGIERSGFLSTDQFVRTLTDNVSTVDGSTFVGSPLSGRANVARGASLNLRGLGTSSTLTLIDGHRIAPSGLNGSFVDVSLIPLSAVERIEILSDGASSIYGSDAIAGVVNFILRDDFRGAETGLSYGTSTQNGLSNFRGSQLLGSSWQGGHFFGVYEHFEESDLRASDRSFVPSIGAPYDLIPDSSRDALFLSMEHKLSDQTELSVSTQYSRRTFAQDSTDPFGSNFDESGTARQLGLSASLQHKFTNDWSALTEGSVSRTKEAIDSVIDTLPFSVRTNGSVASVEARADGPLFQLPAGAVRAAFGSSFRSETFDPGNGDLDRTVSSAFAEVVVPLAHRVDVSLAGRYDHYSDFGSSIDPKFGVAWEVLDGLSLRASYATSFHAPLLSNLTYPPSREFYIVPIPDPNASDLETVTVLPTSPENPDLGPEQSESYTTGFDFSPRFLEGLDVSITYYDIDFTDRIQTPPFGASGIFGIYENLGLYGPYINQSLTPEEIAGIYASGTVIDIFGLGLGPGDVEAVYAFQYQNISETKTSGLNLDIAYPFHAARGEVTSFFNANYILELEDHLAENVRLLNTTYNPMDLRVRTGATWTVGGLSATAAVNYSSDYTNNLAAPSKPVASWTTVDLGLAYRSIDWTLNCAVNNVADRDPPFVNTDNRFGTSVGFDQTNASPRGRFVTLGIARRW